MSPSSALHVDSNRAMKSITYLTVELWVGVESTIISFEETEPVILRLGGVLSKTLRILLVK